MIMKLLKYIAKKILSKELTTLAKAAMSEERVVVKEEVKVTTRLTLAEWTRIKNLLPRQVVTSQTTQLEAAALVGQQRVVELIEKELVV